MSCVISEDCYLWLVLFARQSGLIIIFEKKWSSDFQLLTRITVEIFHFSNTFVNSRIVVVVVVVGVVFVSSPEHEVARAS